MPEIEQMIQKITKDASRENDAFEKLFTDKSVALALHGEMTISDQDILAAMREAHPPVCFRMVKVDVDGLFE